MNAETRATHSYPDNTRIGRISELGIYLQEVGLYPRLTDIQERMLFTYRREGKFLEELRRAPMFAVYLTDERSSYRYAFEQSQSLDELAFGCNARLVVAEARKYRGFSTQDLIQEGNLGLLKAVEKHDPDLGNFQAYARFWIRGAMLAAIPDLRMSIYIPREVLHQVTRLRNIEAEYYSVRGMTPTEEEIRVEMRTRFGLSDKAIDTLIEIANSGVMSVASLDKSVDPSDKPLSSFVADLDPGVNVEQEAIEAAREHMVGESEETIFQANQEYKDRPRPTPEEVAKTLGRSIPTARRVLRRLVKAGLLPPHPKDPRTIDATGFTEHTRMLDSLVENLLRRDPELRNKELAALLADPSRLGRSVSLLTVARARLRLAEAGKTTRRVLPIAEYRVLDSQVEELLKNGMTYKQIALRLEQPVKRVRTAGERLRKNQRIENRVIPSVTKQKVGQYLEEYVGEAINLSEIARQIGVTRERVRQLVKKLNK